jgi:hypothetical protein
VLDPGSGGAVDLDLGLGDCKLSTPFALFARLLPSLWFYNYGGDMDRFQVFYTVDHSF